MSTKRRDMPRLLAWLPSLFERRHACPRCGMGLELTGDPPCEPAERLVEAIVGGRGRVPAHWLEEQIARALYEQEARQGGWALDIGVWGPAIYGGEAAHMVEGLRPTFARVSGPQRLAS